MIKKGSQLQTPNRRSMSKQTKKPQKITKKCLDSVFSSVSEDVSLESPKDSIEFSSISVISDDDQLHESAESFISSLNPVLSPSSETFAPCDLTPLSSTTSNEKDEAGKVSFSHCSIAGSKNNDDTAVMEAEMVVNHLKQARTQVVSSTNTDLRSKKLLDALIELVIEEFNALPKEEDRLAEIVSMKSRVVFMSLLLWILAVLVAFLFRSGIQSSFTEPPPT